MSLNNFIPAVWSAQLLTDLQKSLVYANLCNRDYEGEIRAFGDQVKINSIGDVTIGSYTKNTDISAAETLTDAQRILIINQAKYFNFQIDDIDKAQQTPKVMSAAMQKAAYGLADVAARETIRVSFGPDTKRGAIYRFMDNWARIADNRREKAKPKK